jgi:hypothetical protein
MMNWLRIVEVTAVKYVKTFLIHLFNENKCVIFILNEMDAY